MSVNSNKSVKKSKNKSKTNDVKKDESKEKEKDEVKEEEKDEVKDEVKEVKEEEKDEVKEESKEEVKDESKEEEEDESKDKSKDFFGETKENIFLKETLLDIENKDVELSSDEEDEYDTVKIENNIEYNILDKYHPEMKQLNNNELNSKIFIKRDKDGFIDDVNHTTLPIMTRYERAKILGFRATQINSGADILIDIADNIIDGITIAKMELQQKKIPFIVRRPLPNGKSEYWDINDLEIIE
jgi:DNA-directed RNA polymerase subunit K/omega